MKQFVLLLNFLLVFLAVNAQEEKECKTIRTGTFRSVLNIGGEEFVTMIYRKKDKQVEESTAQGIKMEFDVKWTSPCTYELSKPKVIKGEVPGVSSDQLLYVKILSVTKESYTAEVSSNFFAGTTIFDFTIIK
ncbi:MAG: hypothetical protein ABIR30_09410 [Chitinophagaceae bacterium]